tara:strand:+ start:1318 stop:1647 length:330 start_codon:yes stop_codon:yes gene_type:complete
MDDIEAAKIVLEWANRQYDHWFENRSRALADQAGRIAASKMWEAQNPDDGVGCPSSNPYREDKAEIKRIEDCQKAVQDWGFIRKFLIERVLKGLVEARGAGELSTPNSN